MGLGAQGDATGAGAVEIGAVEDPGAILQGMRSSDLAAFHGESQGAGCDTQDGSSLAKVEPGFNAVCRLAVHRNPIAGS